MTSLADVRVLMLPLLQRFDVPEAEAEQLVARVWVYNPTIDLLRSVVVDAIAEAFDHSMSVNKDRS